MQKQGSAAKRQRQNIKRRTRNRRVKSQVRTIVRSFQEAVEASDRGAAEACFKTVVSRMDKAVSDGVLHRNTAARKKSRMHRLLETVKAS